MPVIAKTDFAAALPASEASLNAGAGAVQPGAAAWAVLMRQLRASLAGSAGIPGTHRARIVVVLPFYQLLPLARSAWLDDAASTSAGFMPRFETTTTWSQRLAHFVPGELDMRFDAAFDALQCRNWLQQAGLAERQPMLGTRLLQTAWQLGGLAAAVHPDARKAWGDGLRSALQPTLQGNSLQYEAALTRIALEWAIASRYATDVLFGNGAGDEFDMLVAVGGLQADPLASALCAHWAGLEGGPPARQILRLAFPTEQPLGQVALRPARDAQDEAEHAAACVLRHVAAGRTPVALPALDRVQTRRISAMLLVHGLRLQDETGWKLSTTRAAAQIMALLRAARYRASADELLDWLKNTRAAPNAVNALEAALRKSNTPNTQFAGESIDKFAIEFEASGASAWSVLQSLRAGRPVADWLLALKAALQSSGVWADLQTDPAGRDALAALHVDDANFAAELAAPLDLADFSGWVQETLESAGFKPDPLPGAAPHVVVLPLFQVLGRPFAALVLPGADGQRLAASPQLLGAWTAQQRALLGLPGRLQATASQRAAWDCALRVPHVDVVWRSMDGDQAVQSSPLVQAFLAQHPGALQTADMRSDRHVSALPTARPLPVAQYEAVPGAQLKISQLSASAYEDLRRCPYRYFALRMLRLQDADELDEEVAKRDFGTWLHDLLRQFHQQRGPADPNLSSDRALLDHIANDPATGLAGLRQRSGFVPYAASWPQVREAYLAWLAGHEQSGWQFQAAEVELQLRHAGILLKGKIDRIDTLARGPEAGMPFVMDYKTESTIRSAERIKTPLEDTQLAFYAALVLGQSGPGADAAAPNTQPGPDLQSDPAVQLPAAPPQDSLQAAYLNISERASIAYLQTEIEPARTALLDGIQADVARIHAGSPMPALGEGDACTYCAARGLCRKDMWTL